MIYYINMKINIDISTEEKRKELFDIFNSFSKKGDIYSYFNIHDSSKNIKYIEFIANEIGFDLSTYKKRRIKYCLNCGKQLCGFQKKFCSSSCSATYNNLLREPMSDSTKDKIRESLRKLYPNKKYDDKFKQPNRKIKPNQERFCVICGNKLSNYNKTCSEECKNKLIKLNNIDKYNKKYEYYLNHQDDFCRPNYIPKFKDKFIEEQSGVCAICGMKPEWNGKPLMFVLDHIDGDASNNRRSNLRCICSNCDSQLDTYKSKNKHSTRTKYWKEKILREAKL